MKIQFVLFGKTWIVDPWQFSIVESIPDETFFVHEEPDSKRGKILLPEDHDLLRHEDLDFAIDKLIEKMGGLPKESFLDRARRMFF